MKRKYKGKKINEYIVLKGYCNAIISIKNVKEKIKFIKINKELKDEVKTHKRQLKSQKNEFDRHIEHLKLTEIAKIENRAIPVIKRSVDRGIKNLQEKLKKFLEQG